MRRKILLLMTMLLAAFAAQAETFEEGGLTYEVTSSNKGTRQYPIYYVQVVAGPSKYKGAVTVPKLFGGSDGKTTYTVTAIADEAFKDCKELTSVDMSAATLLTTIGELAFNDCNKLATVKLPNGLTTIGKYAFYESGLTSIEIPASVTNIEGLPFLACTNLASISVKSGNSKYMVKNDCLLTMDYQLVAVASKECIEVPEGVKEINDAFYKKHDSIKKLTLPSSLTKICDQAFMYCTFHELTCLATTPPTCEILYGRTPFNDFQETCVLTVPAGTKAKYQAAEGWKEFKNIKENGPADEFEYNGLRYKVVSHEERTCEVISFRSDDVLVIPETADNNGTAYTVIGIGKQGYFDGKGSFTTVSLPSTLEYIGAAAFFSTNITSITIPDNVKRIDHSAFARCELTSVKLSSSLETIGDGAFSETGITAIEIPASVKEIGVNPFSDCRGLTSITVASGNSNYYSKNDCLISNDGTLIAGTNKESIEIPEGVTTICKNAFNKFDKLTTLKLPSTVTKIENFGIYNCEKLTELTSLATTPPALGEDVFHNVPTSTCVLTVPAGTKALYQAAEGWEEFQNIQELEPEKTIVNSLDISLDLSGLTFKVGDMEKDVDMKLMGKKGTSTTEGVKSFNSQGLAYFDTSVNMWRSNSASTNLISTETEYAAWGIVLLNDGYKFADDGSLTVTLNGKTLDAHYLDRISDIKYSVFVPITPKDDSDAIHNPTADTALGQKAYNLQGQPVGDGFKGIVIQNGKKMVKK